MLQDGKKKDRVAGASAASRSRRLVENTKRNESLILWFDEIGIEDIPWRTFLTNEMKLLLG